MGLPFFMQMVVIINASAGTVAAAGEALTPEALRSAFENAGAHPEIHYVKPEKIAEALRAAVARRPECIVVGGGDGTLNTAAGMLVGTDIALGVLPLGTLNHFSKDLKIPGEIAPAVELIVAGNIAAIDVAEVNGRFFLNNCSIGAYPAAVQRRDALRAQRGHGKWRAMTLAWIEVFRNLRRLRLSLKIDTAPLQRRSPFLLVSNNHYTGTLFSKSLREHLDGGKLWAYTTRAHRTFPLLRLGLMALLGRLEQADDFESWSAEAIEVSLPGEKINAGIDGEVVEFTVPLRFKIRKGSLRVVAPAVTAAVSAK